jgi:hypothetical protein
MREFVRIQVRVRFKVKNKVRGRRRRRNEDKYRVVPSVGGGKPWPPVCDFHRLRSDKAKESGVSCPGRSADFKGLAP